jgi:hypothetical protein
MALGVKTGGRQKGTPNKTTALLKDAILEAATLAGGEAGLVGYLYVQANANPQSFLPLLGKVLPMQLTGADGGAVEFKVSRMSDAELEAIAAGGSA